MDPYQEYDSEERPHHFPHQHRHHPPPPPPEEPFFGGPPPGEGFPGPRFPPPGEGGFRHEPPPAQYRHEETYRPPVQYSYGEPDRPSAKYSYDEPDRPSAKYSYDDPDRYATADSYSPERKESKQSAISDVPEGLPQGQVVTIVCKGTSSYNLAMGGSGVVMAPANSDDEAQQWVKDCSFGMRIKDNYGFPAFSLVNKATRKLLKHSKERGQQVLSTDYSPDIKDDDILWTESGDFGDGFKTVRSASDTLLNLTIFEGQKKIRNGSPLVLDTWHKADHQLWTLSPL